MVMASTQVARAAAQLHEAAQDVSRVAASRSAQPEDMTMNGRSTGSQHADRHPRLAASQPVLSHHRLPTVTCGRGLLIVQAVSARWGWDFSPGMGGKVVWAVLGGEL